MEVCTQWRRGEVSNQHIPNWGFHRTEIRSKVQKPQTSLSRWGGWKPGVLLLRTVELTGLSWLLTDFSVTGKSSPKWTKSQLTLWCFTIYFGSLNTILSKILCTFSGETDTGVKRTEDSRGSQMTLEMITGIPTRICLSSFNGSYPYWAGFSSSNCSSSLCVSNLKELVLQMSALRNRATNKFLQD